MSVELQKQIKDNSTDVSSYFTDLYNWTEESGKEERRRNLRREARVAEAKGLSAHTVLNNDLKQRAVQQEAKPAETEAKEEAIKRDKIPMPQYYSNWDQFDADAATEKLDEESEQQQRAERKARQAGKDSILDELALRPDGDRQRTTTARPRVKLSVRRSGRRPAPVDIAAPKKDEANRLFTAGRLREAVAEYSKALECLDKYEPPCATTRTNGSSEGKGADGTSTVGDHGQAGDCAGDETEAITLKVALLANRAQALLKMEEWKEVVADCTEALCFNPDHRKATWRRGFAYARLRRWSLAARDLERAVGWDPSDNKAAAELKMTRRMIAEQAKEARQHARNVMQDPTRSMTMPTRRLTVQVKSDKPRAPSRPNGGQSLETTSAMPEERENLAAPSAGIASSSSSTNNRGTAGSDRKPYVPRSVRLRGWQRQPPGQAESVEAEVHANSTANMAATAAAAGSSASSTASPATAMSFYTFEAQWGRLRHRPSDRVALLRRVGPRTLPTLFRESLDSELVASIVDALLVGQLPGTEAKDHHFAAEVLDALGKTPRFELSLRGLSADERARCNQLVTELERQGAHGGEAVGRLSQLFAAPQPLFSKEDVQEEEETCKEASSGGKRTSLEATEPLVSERLEATSFSLDDCD